jgi:hypothetical protein
MPNNIPVDQNAPEFLDRLAASRQMYSSGKTIATLLTILTASSAIVGPIASAVFPTLKVWSALYGAVTLLLDTIFLEPAAKKQQETGAKIQELFDTQLLGIPWNRLKVGAPPDHETVAELARKYRHKHPDLRMLRDWYPLDAGKLPAEYGRLVCQRANMRWDSALRWRYCVLYLALLFLMPVAGLAFGLAMKWELEQFTLAVVVPMLPAAVRIWREYKKQEESAKDSERTKEYLEALWERAINQTLPAQELLAESRLLQDELYDRRRRSPAVPEFLYWFTRESYQVQMEQASAAMVNDVLVKLGQAQDPGAAAV